MSFSSLGQIIAYGTLWKHCQRVTKDVNLTIKTQQRGLLVNQEQLQTRKKLKTHHLNSALNVINHTECLRGSRNSHAELTIVTQMPYFLRLHTATRRPLGPLGLRFPGKHLDKAVSYSLFTQCPIGSSPSMLSVLSPLCSHSDQQWMRGRCVLSSVDWLGPNPPCALSPLGGWAFAHHLWTQAFLWNRESSWH